MKVSIITAVLLSSLAWATDSRAAETQLMNDVDGEAARAEASTSAPENEQQQLSNDMAKAHAEVVEKTAVPPPVVETQAAVTDGDRPARREGFTFELGLGVHYTSEYLKKDERVAGAFGGSVGWFLNDKTALLLRVVGSSVTDNDDFTVFAAGRDRDASRSHGLTTYFIGPQIQFFPIDRFMLAGGVGLAGTFESVRVSVDGTDDGDSHDSRGHAGVGASVRAGVTVYQRKDIAALRIGLEAVPTYIAGDWHITSGLVGELQVF